jgi:TolB protein
VSRRRAGSGAARRRSVRHGGAGRGLVTVSRRAAGRGEARRRAGRHRGTGRGRVGLALVLVGTGLVAGRAAASPPPAVTKLTPTGVSQDGRMVGYVLARIGPDFSVVEYSVRDTRLGRTLVQGGAAPVGADAAGAVSADGRYAAHATVSAYQANPAASQVARYDLVRGAIALGSVTPAALPADRVSVGPALSADGRFLAFVSNATDLVPAPPQTADVHQVYLRDFGTGRTWLVGPGGPVGVAGASISRPALSADGRYLAYESMAGLVPGDTNGRGDVYRWDRVSGATVRVTAGSGSVVPETPSISASGRYVAFDTDAVLLPADTDGGPSVYVRDVTAGRTRLVAAGREPVLTADGRLIAYTSDATALVPGDTNGVADVFVTDLVTGATSRASVDPAGAQLDRASGAPAISPDGRWLAYRSAADNLLPPTSGPHVYEVFLHTREVRRIA